jgi:hypothetical protein
MEISIKITDATKATQIGNDIALLRGWTGLTSTEIKAKVTQELATMVRGWALEGAKIRLAKVQEDPIKTDLSTSVTSV